MKKPKILNQVTTKEACEGVSEWLKKNHDITLSAEDVEKSLDPNKIWHICILYGLLVKSKN